MELAENQKKEIIRREFRLNFEKNLTRLESIVSQSVQTGDFFTSF